MIKRVIAASMIGTVAALLLGGCTLQGESFETLGTSAVQTPAETVEQTPEESRMEEEPSVSDDVELTFPEESSTDVPGLEIEVTTTAEPIEDLPLPTNEAGEWLDYQLDSRLLEQIWSEDARVEFRLNGFPLIYVADFDTQTAINHVVEEYAQNRYSERFQMLDIRFELNCSVMNQSRFVSFLISGTIYHTGDDPRYEPEVPYRYCFTIDRMTGRIIDIETAIGLNTVIDAIRNGRYEVVEADAAVFEHFSNELLALTYQEAPLFDDDPKHEMDFYLQDGYVNVILWVGEENGSYAVFRILDEANLK